jgi:hypothetical protein
LKGPAGDVPLETAVHAGATEAAVQSCLEIEIAAAPMVVLSVWLLFPVGMLALS